MNLVFGAPQIIWFILMIFGIVAMLITNGQEIENKSNSLISIAIANLIVIGMLWWGGFFNHWSYPQTFWIIYFVLSIFGELQNLAIKPETKRINFFHSIASSSLNAGILFLGGFFTGGVLPVL